VNLTVCLHTFPNSSRNVEEKWVVFSCCCLFWSGHQHHGRAWECECVRGPRVPAVGLVIGPAELEPRSTFSPLCCGWVGFTNGCTAFHSWKCTNTPLCPCWIAAIQLAVSLKHNPSYFHFEVETSRWNIIGFLRMTDHNPFYSLFFESLVQPRWLSL